jgi:CTP:molybdopterin cytidylyltransferase MocA
VTKATIAGVVLAAGEASRFGGPKQVILLPHVLRRLRPAALAEVVVVLGAHRIPVTGARTVICPDWQRGPGASLRAGLAALTADVEAAVVVEAWHDGAGEVVAASYGGVRGHPLLLARTAWPRIPDEGGRALEAVLVPCDDLGFPEDVDTAEDLRRIEAALDE